jgi:hypothetical protein
MISPSQGDRAGSIPASRILAKIELSYQNYLNEDWYKI